MMTLGLPWPILRQGQFWKHTLLHGKKWKLWIFWKLLQPEIWKVVVTDNYWSRWRYMINLGQGHLLTLASLSSIHTFQSSSSLKPLGQSKWNFMWSLHETGEGKFDREIWVTWPRWPPRPYMVKNTQKSSSPEPAGRFSRNLVCSIWDSSPS